MFLSYHFTYGANSSIDILEHLLLIRFGLSFIKRNGSYRGGDYIDTRSNTFADCISIEPNFIQFTGSYQIEKARNFPTLLYFRINEGTEEDKLARYTFTQEAMKKAFPDWVLLEDSIFNSESNENSKLRSNGVQNEYIEPLDEIAKAVLEGTNLFGRKLHCDYKMRDSPRI